MRRARRHGGDDLGGALRLLVLVLLVGGTGSAARAQDALRGKRLYLDAAGEVGSGVSCVDCHGGLPGGLFGIGRAANDPARIAQAIDSVPAMAPFRDRFDDGDRADLAAYLGDPLVPSPQVTVTTMRHDGSAGPAERVDFGTLRAGEIRDDAVVTIASTGPLAFTLTAAPQILSDEVGAGGFALTSTDCTAGQRLEPQQTCRVAVRFSATGADGSRAARLRIEHDWVGGAAALALLGRVGDPAAPDEPGAPDEPAPPSRSASGCRSSTGGGGGAEVWSALLGIFALGWLRRRRRPDDDAQPRAAR